MIDYLSILARAVATLNPNTSEQRRALYERARQTLVDKFRASDPTQARAELTSELAALETAIQRIERDLARRAAPPSAPPPRQIKSAPAPRHRDRPPLRDTRRPLHIIGGAAAVALVVAAGAAVYSFWPRNLEDLRNLKSTKMVTAPVEEPNGKSGYVNLRQLVYYRTNQPVGTIVVDKTQTFLYVVRPNISALRYSIGIGSECVALAGLYHVVRKEQPGNSNGESKNSFGARILYLDKEYRIHGTDAANAVQPALSEGCIRLVNDDVIYLYDRTPLESRVVVSN
jgi:lipoprotein-anchoring transpeptidase ErfK/SrfK